MNILVIVLDQLRYDAIRCNGNKFVDTPNINRLAEKCVKFRNAYSQAPVCAPARHSIATGKYPCHHGVMTNSDFPYPGMYTVAHALKPLNYRRLQLGNMHWRGKDVDNGFEPLACASINKDGMPPLAYKHYQWEHEDFTRRLTAGPSVRKRDEYWGYQVAAASVRQLKEVVERGERFLSWNCFIEPHPPFYPPKEFFAKIAHKELPLPLEAPEDAAFPHPSVLEKQKEWSHFTSEEKRRMKSGYYGMVELADSYVGMLLDFMDRNDLWKNTMVIFTTDHGEQLGDHGLFLKFVLREASVHIPLMIYHPDAEPGFRDQFAEQVDIFATICDYTGAPMPNDLDGRTLKPLIENNETPEGWRTEVFAEIGTHKMIRTAEWKLNVYDGIPGELFHLTEDPHEFNNLCGKPEYQSIITELYEKMKKKTEN